MDISEQITDKILAQQTIRTNQILTAIKSVHSLMLHEQNTGKMLERVCQLLVEHQGYYYALIVLFDLDGQVSKVYQAGSDGNVSYRQEKLLEGYLPDCIVRASQSGKVQMIKNPVRDCQSCPIAIPECERTSLSVALSHRDQLLGVIKVTAPSEYAETTLEHDLLNDIAADLAFAIFARQTESDKLQLQSKYAAVIATTNDAVITTDLMGRITVWNPGAEKLFGFSAQDIMGESIHKLIAPDYLSQYMKFFGSALNGQTITGLEMVGVTKGQSRIPIEMTLSLKNDRMGNPGGISALIRDITERKEAEQALRDSEANYQALFHQMLDGFALHEMIYDEQGHSVDYRFLAINPAFERLTGLRADNLIGKTVLEVMPDTEAYWIESYGQVVATGEPVYFENYSRELDKYYTVTAYRAAPSQFACIFEDITDRKKAEEARFASEARFRALFESAPVGIYETDAIGNCLLVNKKWCEMAGITEQDAHGDGWQQGLHPDDRERIFTLWNQYAQSKQPWDFEYRFCSPDNQVSWVWGTAVALTNERGDITGYIGVNTDITERKLAEEALRANENRQRDLFNSVHAGIILQRADGVISYINQVAAEAFQMAQDDALGRTSNDPEWQMIDESGRSVPGGEHPSMMTFRTGQPVRGAVRGLFAGNPERMRWLMINTQPILDDSGGVAEVLITFLDITDLKQTEKALEESQLRQQEAVRAGNVGLWDWDLTTNKVQYSSEWKKIVGYEGDEISDSLDEWRNRVHPDDQEILKKHIDTLIGECRQNYRVEFRFQHKDGSYLWILAQGSVLVDQDNRPVRVIGSQIDITDRKRAEETIREHERMLATLLGNLPGMVYRCRNDEKWTMEYLSSGVTPLTGYAIDDLCHNQKISFNSLIYPEDRDKVRQAINQALEAKQSYQLEYRIQTADHKIKWVWEQGCGVYEGDRLLHLEGFVNDISDRKQAERALIESEERFQLLFEEAPLGYQSLDINGHIKVINRKWLELLGYELDEVIGKWFGDFLAPESLDTFKKNFSAFKERGHVRGVEFQMIARDGSRKMVTFDGNIGYDKEGGFKQTHCIVQDISARRKAEMEREKTIGELQAKNAELEQFTYTVSHDLKGPLVSVNGMLGLIEDDLKDGNQPEAMRHFDILRSATTTMSTRIQDVLNYIRMGYNQPVMKSVPLNRIITNVLNVLSGLILEKGVTVEMADPMPEIVCDEPQMMVVFENLIENAIKFMGDQPEPRIEVSAEPVGDMILCVVRDNGIGIQSQYHEKIFRLFDKLDPASSGTGVGLTIVKRIVERHQGSIRVEPGADSIGSRFIVSLPTKVK